MEGPRRLSPALWGDTLGPLHRTCVRPAVPGGDGEAEGAVGGSLQLQLAGAVGEDLHHAPHCTQPAGRPDVLHTQRAPWP